MNTAEMTATDRVALLLQSTLSGRKIAYVLRHAGYTADEAEEALLAHHFVVQRENAEWATILRVSSKPAESAAEVAGALLGNSAEIAWHTKEHLAGFSSK